MFHHRTALAPILDRHQIEPVFVIRSTVPQQPDAGHPGDMPLLPPAYRFESAAADVRAACLHLDERDCPALANDHINVVAAQLEAMGLDQPPARGEKRDGNALSLEAEQLTLIVPFGYGNDPAGGCQAPWYAGTARSENRSAARWGGKSR